MTNLTSSLTISLKEDGFGKAARMAAELERLRGRLKQLQDASKKLDAYTGLKPQYQAAREAHAKAQEALKATRVALAAAPTAALRRQHDQHKRQVESTAAAYAKQRAAMADAVRGVKELGVPLRDVGRYQANYAAAIEATNTRLKAQQTAIRASASAIAAHAAQTASPAAVAGRRGRHAAVAPAVTVHAAATAGAKRAFGGVTGALAIGGPAVAAYAAGRFAIDSTKTFATAERRMTRIGITANASRAEMALTMKEAQDLARESTLAFDEIVKGYEALAAQGRTHKEMRDLMPAVVRTAQASGADVGDIANAAGAVSDQLEIAASKMQSAFDIMAEGGKAGKFELKDMARYLPSLAPLAASVGMKGEEGLRKLIAVAQVVRNQTGTAEEAAASLQNIFAKMESETTVDNFKEFGVDLEKEFAKARAGGKDLLATFVELTNTALKGDLSKIPKLFQDMELARGMRALTSQAGLFQQIMGQIRNSPGAVMRDFNRVLEDSQAKIDRLSVSWDRFKTSVGSLMATSGVPGYLDRVSDVISMTEQELERYRRGEPTKGGEYWEKRKNKAMYGHEVTDKEMEGVHAARREKEHRDKLDREVAELGGIKGRLAEIEKTRGIWGRVLPGEKPLLQRRARELEASIARAQADNEAVLRHGEVTAAQKRIGKFLPTVAPLGDASPETKPGRMSFGFGVGGSQTGNELLRGKDKKGPLTPAPWGAPERKPWSPPSSDPPLPPRRPTPDFKLDEFLKAQVKVETDQLEQVQPKAEGAKNSLTQAFATPVKVQVDTSDLSSLLSLIGQAKSELESLGAAASRAKTNVGRDAKRQVQQNYSDA